MFLGDVFLAWFSVIFSWLLFYFCSKMGNIFVVGPNEALIISGGCGCGSKVKKKIIIGNWVWAWWMFNDIQLLPLELFTLKPSCENVNTLNGVPVCITGLVQCKFIRQREFLQLAAEQFLGLTRSQVRIMLLETIEGHMRTILGTKTNLMFCLEIII